MCKFCSRATSITIMPYIERTEDVNVWRLPQRQICEIEKIPVVKIALQNGCNYKPFYKKPFLFCPYCGRKLQEEKQ